MTMGRTENPCVDGSIPPPGTISKPAFVKHFRALSLFPKLLQKPSKYPGCVPSCVRENLIVSNSNQFRPKMRECRRRLGKVL